MKRNILLILLAILPFFAFGYRDPETGTFLTRDPAGMADGPNEYCYVHQNPWTHFDPHGLFPDAQTTFHGLSEQQEIQVSKDVSIGAAASVPFAFVGTEGIGGMGIGWGGRMAYMGLQTGGAGVIGRSISDGLSGTSSTTQQLSGTGAFSAIAGVGLQAAGEALTPVLSKAASILNNSSKVASAPGATSAQSVTVGNILKGHDPQSMIHLTTGTEDEIMNQIPNYHWLKPPATQPGILPDSSWVKLQEVGNLTLPQYQRDVVLPNAAGNYSTVKGFAVSKPGSADFKLSSEQVSSVATEYRNTSTVKPDAYVPIPAGTPQNVPPATK